MDDEDEREDPKHCATYPLLPLGMPSPAALFASLIVSGIGYVAFSYGRKQRRAPPLAIGILLMLFPYFVESAGAIYGIGAALCALLWLLVKQGY